LKEQKSKKEDMIGKQTQRIRTFCFYSVMVFTSPFWNKGSLTKNVSCGSLCK